MTARSIRRAAERKAKKAALKAERNQIHQAAEPVEPRIAHQLDHATPLAESLCWTPEPEEDTATTDALLFTAPTVSSAQLAANKANAQLSTGPSSPAGKTKSSLNAVKTALTGRTVLLPTEDAADYERHLLAYQQDFRPVGVRESDLVQSIADSAWRLKRIPGLEAAIYAQGHIEFGEAFEHHAAALRAGMIELQTHLKYEKQLRNLQLQEARLARRREKEIAELRQVQQARREAEEQLTTGVAEARASQTDSGAPVRPAANGFVFSNGQFEVHPASARSENKPPTREQEAAELLKQAA